MNFLKLIVVVVLAAALNLSLGSIRVASAAPPEAPSDVAKYLPQDALFLVTMPSAKKVAQILDVAGLKKIDPGIAAKISQVSVATIGHDMANVAHWPKLGINPDGPVALALLNVTHFELAFCFTVTDENTLEAAITRLILLMRQKVRREVHSGTVILAPGRHPFFAMAIRDKMSCAFFTESPSNNQAADEVVQMDLARAFATRAAKTSLASNAKFNAALRRVPGTSHVQLWVDVGRLVKQCLNLVGGYYARGSQSYAARKLQNAKDNGDPPETISKWQKQVDEDKAWEKRRQAEHKTERTTIETIFGAFEHLAVGLTLVKNRLEVSGHVDIGPKSFLRRILRSSKGMSATFRSIDSEPSMIVHAAIEPNLVKEAMDLLATVEPRFVKNLDKFLRTALGTDLAEVATLISGEGGASVSVDFGTHSGSHWEWGFSLNSGITNTKRVNELLDRAASTLGIAKFFNPQKKDGVWTIAIPHVGKVYIQAKNSQLTVSTEPGFAGAVQRPTAMGKWLKKMKNNSLRKLLSMKDSVAIWAIHSGQLVVGFSRALRGKLWPSIATADGNESAATAKLVAELNRTQARIEALKKPHLAMELKQSRAMGALLGMTVLAARETATGFEVLGGQYFEAETVAAALHRFLTTLRDFVHASDKHRKQVRPLREKVSELQRKLNAMRTKKQGPLGL